MIKIKIAGRPYLIPSVSQLTFTQWNKIFITSKVSDLPEYLSFFTDIPVDQLMESRLSGASIPALHALIFNVDQGSVLKDRNLVFEYKGEYRLIKEMDFDTFGALYHYEIYRSAKDDERINQYELAMYALAITMAGEDEIEPTYKALCGMVWTKVLPHAFFLNKEYMKGNVQRLMSSMTFIWGLKAIQWKIRGSRESWRKLERI